MRLIEHLANETRVVARDTSEDELEARRERLDTLGPGEHRMGDAAVDVLIDHVRERHDLAPVAVEQLGHANLVLCGAGAGRIGVDHLCCVIEHVHVPLEAAHGPQQ
eukprot:4541015-Prymnesium_polylepis.1